MKRTTRASSRRAQSSAASRSDSIKAEQNSPVLPSIAENSQLNNDIDNDRTNTVSNSQSVIYKEAACKNWALTHAELHEMYSGIFAPYKDGKVHQEYGEWPEDFCKAISVLSRCINNPAVAKAGIVKHVLAKAQSDGSLPSEKHQEGVYLGIQAVHVDKALSDFKNLPTLHESLKRHNSTIKSQRDGKRPQGSGVTRPLGHMMQSSTVSSPRNFTGNDSSQPEIQYIDSGYPIRQVSFSPPRSNVQEAPLPLHGIEAPRNNKNRSNNNNNDDSWNGARNTIDNHNTFNAPSGAHNESNRGSVHEEQHTNTGPDIGFGEDAGPAPQGFGIDPPMGETDQSRTTLTELMALYPEYVIPYLSLAPDMTLEEIKSKRRLIGQMRALRIAAQRHEEEKFATSELFLSELERKRKADDMST
ncbi:hypothetical protein EJ05DRAFT_503839 [Pseudovirgaria hyperparasitica]|uniref:Uncharacterized protein n=1 Tax=Pseudovirgaria hyperparasitica TaxID=470096 RepID=A0A6A6VYI8_9PEZI|nr:uncharacterized protein EJ05DRAFT_503839 [Pseudovirgaria hyperparasitica]KAF2754896.1 hypothetical protein EJ05DRAFT_503839 [Pseudovirgaria hyperparasitica]